uniref:C2H2-type domain-containing protein n=1 Tax=Ciona savignyi TaxID=51511 RepID=H2ZLP1_CIOSA
MEFEKHENENVNVISVPILQDPQIMMPQAQEKTGLNEENFTTNSIDTSNQGDLIPSNDSPNPTNLPIYLFTTEGSDGSTQRYIVSDPFKDAEIGESSNLFKDSYISVGTSTNLSSSLSYPLSYYTSNTASGDSSQILSILHENQGTSNVNTQVTSSNLSEEMIRSFVVGGNPQQSQGATDPSQVVTAIINDDEKKSISTADKQVIILTEGPEADDLVIEDESYFQDGELDNYEGGGEFTVTLLPNKEDIQVYDETGLGGWCDVITNEDTELDLQFEVAGEITNLDGQLLRREIVTQTNTWKKLKAPIKHKESFKSNLIGNKTKKQSKKQFKCERCSARFERNEDLDLHSKCHTTIDKIYKCFHCEERFDNWPKMHQHLFSHGIEKPHKCLKCSFSSMNRSDLSAHSFVHSQDKHWLCTKCDRQFKHRRNMVAHHRTCAGLDETGKLKTQKKDEKFVCSVCQKQLSNKRSLDKHFEIHLDVKPFVCDLCGHSTRLKESLIMHKRLHTGEKPYKCDVCNYATPDKSSLRRHKRRHSDEKPYKCSFCGYKCIQKHCLDNHVRRKHTGEQFVCGLCHFSTHDRYGLNQHFKQHQGNAEINNNQQAIVNISTDGVVTTVSKEEEVSTKPDLEMDFGNGESMVLQIQPSGENKNENWAAADTPLSGNVVLNKDLLLETQPVNIEAIPVNSVEPHVIQLTGPEGTLLQQIQQPGDLVFLRGNGELLIKRSDGTILLIQQQLEDKENPETSPNAEA